MRHNEISDDYGVQSLRDSMFDQGESRDEMGNLNAAAEQREFEIIASGVEYGNISSSSIGTEMDNDEDHDDQPQPHDRPSRPRQSSEISSSSGTILAGQRSSRTVHLDLSQLDPEEFPAILNRSNIHPFRSESPSHMYQEHSPPQRSTPETTSRPETYPYASPDSSTVSLPTSSYISISSLSRGSSPFAGSSSSTPARESGDSPASHPRDRTHPLQFGARPSYPGRYDQSEQGPSVYGHVKREGHDISLVLPLIALPGSMIRDRSRTPSPTWGSHNAREARNRTRGPLDIILTGPKAGVDDFVRHLDEVEGIRLFRIENGGSAGKQAGERERRAIAVIQMGPGADEGRTDGGDEGVVDGKNGKLLARLHLMMDREERNLEQSLNAVEAMYGRLNRLLAQEPVESPYEEDASRLVASWIESCKSDQIASSSARQQDHASWFDFVIVTGEKQVLLNQDYDRLVHLMSVAPTVCWPAGLQDGLARHLPLPFFKLVHGAEPSVVREYGLNPEPTPRCQANTNKIDSYFPSSAQRSPRPAATQDAIVEALIAMLRSDQAGRQPDRQTLSRANIRSVDVQHFLAWQRGRSFTNLSVETPHMSQAIQKETQPAQTASVNEMSPDPPDTRRGAERSARNNTATSNEWEAGLSRRHAFRRRNETRQHRKKRSIQSRGRGTSGKRDLFWTPSSSSEDTPTLSRSTVPDLRTHPVRIAIGDMMRRFGLSKNISPPTPLRDPWTWMGVTCIGLAVGFGCAYFTGVWNMPSIRL